MPAAGKGGGRRVAKSTAKKAAPKKAAIARGRAASGAKKTRATKTPAKKTRVKKTPVKKTRVKKTPVKKAPVKRAAKPKKASPKKAPVAKKAAKKAPTKSAAKAPVAKKTVKEAGPVKKGGKKTVICELSGFEVTPGTPNLSPRTLERLKGRLLDERERLLRQADDFAAEAEQLAREREGGDTQFDEESGEGDTVNVERERDLLLSASARQEVEDIEKALQRMKRGTYGVCRYAGRRIPVERLEVRPWADVCVDCKARAERRR